jgi:phosphonate transport system substrate-binding protein
MKIFAAIISFCALFVLQGCKNTGGLDKNGVPDKITFAFFASENPDQMREIYGPICNYLEKKLNIPVEMLLTTDYSGVIEALKSKKVQMAYMGPFAYIIATRTISLTPVVIMGAEGKPSMYHSMIVVKGNSDLNSIADVKKQAKSLSLCFVDPASTSGHLIPRAYLNSISLNPDTAFKQTVFAGSHIASALTIKSGKVDIGCVSDISVNRLIRKGMLQRGDLRALWVSAPIVNSIIVARSDLNKQFVKKVQDLYLNLNKDAPQIFQIYNKLIAQDTIRRGYIVAQDSFYNGLRKIANNIKGLKAE